MAKQAGEDTDARCSKCKLVLAHVIVATDGPRIVRVQCKTCGGVHAYRSPADSKKSSKTKAVRSRASSKKTQEVDYDRAIANHDISRARHYRTSESFDEGEVLSHRTFGLGLVTRLIDNNKIEAIFPAGCRVLIHNRSDHAR